MAKSEQLKQIPACYFPSTVIFIDDSRDFLVNFTLQLDDRIVFKVFSSPHEALEAVHAVHLRSNFDQHYLAEYADAKNNLHFDQRLDMDFSALHYEMYNPQRYREVAVVVVDYDMPGMNGLEFCKQMENSPIKRILLTGRADEIVAIKAFNQGIIDVYLRKQDKNLAEMINRTIFNFQRVYFENMSDTVVRMLTETPPECLHDAPFVDLIDSIVKEHDIVEYYIMDESGSYLFMDRFDNIYFFAVCTEQDFEVLQELVQASEAPDAFREAIVTKQMMPAFWQKDQMFSTDWTEWEKIMMPVNKLEGKQTYYYSLKKNPENCLVERDKVLSLHQYLQKASEEESALPQGFE